MHECAFLSFYFNQTSHSGSNPIKIWTKKNPSHAPELICLPSYYSLDHIYIYVCVCVLSSSADCADDAESTDPGCAAGEAWWSERLAVRLHGEVSHLIFGDNLILGHMTSVCTLCSCHRAESAVQSLDFQHQILQQGRWWLKAGKPFSFTIFHKNIT